MDLMPTRLSLSRNDNPNRHSTSVGTGSILVIQKKESKTEPQRVKETETLSRIPITIWNESRFILRAWALCISALAFLLLLSLADGRLAVIEVSIHSEVLGYWTNCQYHICPNLGKVTVSKHLGMGIMILALASEIFCLFFMGFSFRPIFRRISRCDLVFCILNYTTGVLISLSLLLFTIECWTLSPIKVTYVPPYYLCWSSAAMQFSSGTLCLINSRHTFNVPATILKSNPVIAAQQRTPPHSQNGVEGLRVGRRRTTFQLTPQVVTS